MQRTIIEQLAAPIAGQAEPEVLQRVRTDPRICSVVTVRGTNPGKGMETYGLAKTGGIEMPTSNTESFLVTDLLEDITYMVRQEGSLSKLVFTLKDEQVMVAIQPDSDLTEIAHDLAVNLATITTHN